MRLNGRNPPEAPVCVSADATQIDNHEGALKRFLLDDIDDRALRQLAVHAEAWRFAGALRPFPYGLVRIGVDKRNGRAAIRQFAGQYERGGGFSRAALGVSNTMVGTMRLRHGCDSCGS
jgi:hypothetical protein